MVLHIMARINIIPVRGILNKTKNAPRKLKVPPIHIIIIIMLVLHDMIHWDSTKLQKKLAFLRGSPSLSLLWRTGKQLQG